MLKTSYVIQNKYTGKYLIGLNTVVSVTGRVWEEGRYSFRNPKIFKSKEDVNNYIQNIDEDFEVMEF